jgi:hypothetical protein
MLVDDGRRWFWTPRDPLEQDWKGPEGARIVGGGGEGHGRAGTRLTDVDLQSAARIQPGANGSIWLLSIGGLIHALDGRIERTFGNLGEANTLATRPDGAAAVSDLAEIDVYGSGAVEHRTIDAQVGADSLTFASDGELIVGSATSLHLFEVTLDGVSRPLFGPPDGPQARAGRVAFVTLMPDGQVVFASREHDGTFELSQLVDGRDVPIGDQEGEGTRRGLSSVASMPDGRLLLTTNQRIEAVDVDSGESETLVELDGAEGTFSAAAVGDDLIFLADGRLWQMEDTFG